MVTVSRKHPLQEDGSISVEDWLENINIRREPEQMSRLCDAIELVLGQHQRWEVPEGESVVEHGLAISEILAELDLDTDALCAGLIYPSVEFGELKLEQVADKAGSVVAKLIEGVQKMQALRDLQDESTTQLFRAEDLDALRKMLLAMVDDTRVVLVKLARRVQVLRLAKHLPQERREKIAMETQNIYAPLANRLGIGQLKWELEDLAFRYLQPDKYKSIATKLKARRIDREHYIELVIETIRQQLQDAGIEGEIAGRAKHLYSIWRKMERKQVNFDEIYDARAVRVRVKKIADCYAVLGIVHSLWKHIPKEFDDYIATPKPNGYQSIHTAVIGPDEKALEVQIRTYRMHQDSEQGVAAHWRYKEGSINSADQAAERKIAWLRQLMEWQKEVAPSEELLSRFQQDAVEERIYVFTPNGRVVDLPPGATPLDFAYLIHTDIGHTCVGAKANGKMVPLTHRLSTGQHVEIITRKNATPSRDWLSVHGGYLKSTRARAKVNQWFRKQDRGLNIEAGRPMLLKELERNGQAQVDLLPVARKLNLKSIDDLYAAVGMGDLGAHQISNAVANMQPKPVPEELQLTPHKHHSKRADNNGIMVVGVGDLLTHIAGCCKPVPGDLIAGFVTRGRGVTVHRADCRYIEEAQNEGSERLIEVEWSDDLRGQYAVDLSIRALERRGLLRDLTQLLANMKLGLLSANTHVNRRTDRTDIGLRVEVANQQQLDELLGQIRQLPNVIHVQRNV